MNSLPEKKQTDEVLSADRKPYAKPELTRVDLAMAETLSTGCKMGSNYKCVGPPITAYEGGS